MDTMMDSASDVYQKQPEVVHALVRPDLLDPETTPDGVMAVQLSPGG
jgi:hypothetical protein